MNRKTFNQLFDSKVLRPTPIRMENYGNSTVKVLGMFHAFLRWKDRVLQTIILCDRLWQIPELVVKGCLLHSGCSQTLLHGGEGQWVHNDIWHQIYQLWQMYQRHHFRRWKEAVGNCPTIPRNSQFHRVTWKITLWWSRTFFMCTLMSFLG